MGVRLIAAAALVLASAVVLVAEAAPAAACSCAVASDEEHAARADAVFVGELVEVAQPDGGSSIAPARYSFAVTDVYRGAVRPDQDVVSAVSEVSCGLGLPGRESYLVFARQEPSSTESRVPGDALYANLCGGTRPVSEGAIPASFGSPQPPAELVPAQAEPPGTAPTVPEPSETPRSPGLRSWVVIVLAGGLVVAGGTIAVAARRRRSVHPD